MTPLFNLLANKVAEYEGLTRLDDRDALMDDLHARWVYITSLCPSGTPHQIAALVSVARTIGMHALKASMLLRYHNAGDYNAAYDQFFDWNKATVRFYPDVVARRAWEATLYRDGLPSDDGTQSVPV